MGGERTNGLQTAIAQANAQAPAEPEAIAEQLPLYPAERLGDLTAAEGLGGEILRRAQLRGPRGPGRPPGSANKQTVAWRDFLLARYRSPLQALAETYSRAVSDLAAELGCTRLEAFQLQIKAAIELAPYVHGKMPAELKLTGTRPLLILADPAQFVGDLAAGVDDDRLLDLSSVEIVSDQQLSAPADGRVGQAELDSDGKAQSHQEVSAPEPLMLDQPAKDQGDQAQPGQAGPGGAK